MRRTAKQPMNGDVQLEIWLQRQSVQVAEKTGSRWLVEAFLKQKRYPSTPGILAFDALSTLDKRRI